MTFSTKYLTYLIEYLNNDTVRELLYFIYGKEIFYNIYNDFDDEYKEFFIKILLCRYFPIYQDERLTLKELLESKMEYDSIGELEEGFNNTYSAVVRKLNENEYYFNDTFDDLCNMVEVYNNLYPNINDTDKTFIKYIGYITKSLESFEVNIKHEEFRNFINTAVLDIIEKKRCYILAYDSIDFISFKPIVFKNEKFLFNDFIQKKSISYDKQINNIENINVKHYIFKEKEDGIYVCSPDERFSERINGYSKVFKRRKKQNPQEQDNNQDNKTDKRIRSLIGLREVSAYINANINLDNAVKKLENNIKEGYCHICYPLIDYENSSYKCDNCTEIFKKIQTIYEQILHKEYTSNAINTRIKYCPKDRIISTFEDIRMLHYDNLCKILEEIKPFVKNNTEIYKELKRLVDATFKKN